MTSICTFCCASIEKPDENSEEPEVTSSSVEVFKTFLKVSQSHFGVHLTNIMEKEGADFHDKAACLKCEQSVKLVCQLYQDLESIRLKMVSEFGKLISKMEDVGRTPTKVKRLRKNQSADEFENMGDFRNAFLSRCNQSLSSSVPVPSANLHKARNRRDDDFPNKPIGTKDDVGYPDIPDDISDDIDDTITNFLDKEDFDKDDNQNDQNDKHYQAQDQLPAAPPVPVINDLDNADDKPPPSNEKPVMCPHCSVRFSHKKSLQRHQRKYHRELYQLKRIPSTSKTSKPVKKISKQSEAPKTPKFVPCSICQLPLGNKKRILESHFDVHHSTKDIDPETVHKCDHANCPAYFRTLFQVTRHKKDVHGEKDDIPKTTCPICSKICSGFGNLKFHMRTQHNDESPDLPLACDVPECPKRFPTEAILKWHQMYFYHSNRKQSFEVVKCPECHQDYYGVGALKTHLKTHERPEAPYVCELCGAAFKRKSILVEHGWFHQGPDNWEFQCKECGKRCATKHKLKDHMKVHSDVKTHSCEACGKGYKCRQKLREHINKFHAEEGFQDIPRKRAKAKLISRRKAT